MRTQSYPSDLTDAQWRLLEPHLPVYPGGRPRATNLRDVVDAIFYILRTGCQWRYIPKDFPPKSTVWKYFDQWRRNGTFEKIHDLLRRKVRSEEKPYSPRTTASVDSQSVDTKGKKEKVLGFQFSFSGALNGGSSPSSYHVTQKIGKKVKNLPVRSVSYNPGTFTVNISVSGFTTSKPALATITGLVGANGAAIAPIVTGL
ncbi:MAG: IS5 family transposase [Isosphaeraceae bacterium]